MTVEHISVFWLKTFRYYIFIVQLLSSHADHDSSDLSLKRHRLQYPLFSVQLNQRRLKKTFSVPKSANTDWVNCWSISNWISKVFLEDDWLSLYTYRWLMWICTYIIYNYFIPILLRLISLSQQTNMKKKHTQKNNSGKKKKNPTLALNSSKHWGKGAKSPPNVFFVYFVSHKSVSVRCVNYWA